MTEYLFFVGILVMGRTWIRPHVPSWRHGHTNIMPCLQEYGSPPLPLELSSSPELQNYCFPGMAVAKHFLPISWKTVSSEKKPQQIKNPYNTKKPAHPKPNPVKPNPLSTSASMQDLLQVTATTCLFHNIRAWSKEKQQRRAAVGEN